MVGGINGAGRVVLGPVPAFDRRKRVRARARLVEIAGDGQHGIAESFAIEPLPRKSRPEPPISGVKCRIV